jgi:two-component sensor histidine kinase
VTVSSSSSERQGLVLEVHDDGIGLPEGFDVERGTGLGMVVVSTLTRQLGATLVVKSGPGTTFRLELPLQAEDGGAAG